MNWANFNLGVAVIMLTIALRIVLIPFTYFVERGKVIGAQLLEEVNQANRDFGRPRPRADQGSRKYYSFLPRRSRCLNISSLEDHNEKAWFQPNGD